MSIELPDLGNWLEGQETRNLFCRRWGHNWQPFRWYDKPDKGVATRIILRCPRCHNRAVEDTDYDGYSHRSIEYVEGYLAPKGMGRLTREDRAALRVATDTRLRTEGTIKRGQ